MAELQKKTSEGIGMAMNAHDAKKIASFYTENAVLKMAGMPDLDRSRGDRRRCGRRTSTPRRTRRARASRVFMKGDVVVVEWAWAGTHSGDMMGIKATEKPVGAMGVDVMWFSPDGLVKEQHTYIGHGHDHVADRRCPSRRRAPFRRCRRALPRSSSRRTAPDETKNVESRQQDVGRLREEERSRLPRRR